MVDEYNPQDHNGDEDGSFDQFETNNQNGQNDHYLEEDDFLAADRGVPDDLDVPAPKPSLKEIWQQNPSVKIFAGVAFVAVCLISFLVFGSGDKEKEGENTSVVASGGTVSQAPGTQELPPAYEKAVREASEQRASDATNSGGSAIPTPIARPSERIEAPVQTEQNDPLSEWRREAEQRRTESQEETKPSLDANIPVLPTSSTNGTTPPAMNLTNANNNQPAAPQNPPLPTSPSGEQINTVAQQLQVQMQTIMETQIPKESVVVSMNIQPTYDAKKYFGDPQAQAAGGAAATGGNGAAGNAANVAPPPKPIIQAGTIIYGQILTQASSDVPGPVLAEVASGPLMGGRAIGTFSLAQRQLVMTFNRVIKDGVEYPVEAYALDPATTLPALATDVDGHYFTRIMVPAAARFIQGFADAATQKDTSVVVTNGAVVTNSNNDLDTKQELLNGANAGAQQASSVLQQDFGNRQITVTVAAGTRIGLLFTSSVFDPAAMQAQQGQYGQQGQYPGQYQAQNPYQQQLLGNAASYAGVAGQAYNAYNAYNNANGANVSQQYYQQYPQQQQQYTSTPNISRRY